MNAGDQKRLTPFLIAACVVAAAILVIMLTGVGSSVHWGVAQPAHRDAAIPAGTHPQPTRSQPLDAYAVVWQRPLFNQQRQPAPSRAHDKGQRVSLGDLQLTGIILTPGLHMALMHNRKSDHDIRVREGDTVPHGSWVLHELKPRQAVFVDGGKRTTLVLKVAPEHGAAAGQPDRSGASAQNEPIVHTPQHRQPTGSHSQLSMRPSRPAPTASAKAAARKNQARMQAIKARIKAMRRQQRERRDKDGGS